MPTTVIDARVTFQEDDKVWLELQSDNKSLDMTVLLSQTLDEIATLIINQEMSSELDKTLQQRFTINWHLDNNARIVDDVQIEQLPNEAAKDGFDNLPGWATWTAGEASDWIDINVTDLASAKIAMQAIAQAIVYLRDWRKD